MVFTGRFTAAHRVDTWPMLIVVDEPIIRSPFAEALA